MTIVLCLLAIQGVIGAFDTFYYHEWRARLPARGRAAAAELKLHAMRDFLYALIFVSLPWVAWHGKYVFVLAAILIAEIIFTMWDFIVEISVRKSLGDVYAGERVTHAVMGIIYGAMIASLTPVLFDWSDLPTEIVWTKPQVPDALRWALTVMAAGVFLSGLRDLYAAFGLPHGSWPWPLAKSDHSGGEDVTRP